LVTGNPVTERTHLKAVYFMDEFNIQ